VNHPASSLPTYSGGKDEDSLKIGLVLNVKLGLWKTGVQCLPSLHKQHPDLKSVPQPVVAVRGITHPLRVEEGLNVEA
jgi:hypothetical protein